MVGVPGRSKDCLTCRRRKKGVSKSSSCRPTATVFNPGQIPIPDIDVARLTGHSAIFSSQHVANTDEQLSNVAAMEGSVFLSITPQLCLWLNESSSSWRLRHPSNNHWSALDLTTGKQSPYCRSHSHTLHTETNSWGSTGAPTTRMGGLSLRRQLGTRQRAERM